MQMSPDNDTNSTLRAAKSIWKDWYQIKYFEMPRPYIHHIHSHPRSVSESVWKQWYQEERSRDMVYFKVSSTAAIYHSLCKPLTYLNHPEDGLDKMDFLEVYQMGSTPPEEMKQYFEYVRTHSQLWEENQTRFGVGGFVPDHLELIEILGSYEYNENVAPFIIHAKIVGKDVEAKLHFEHVNAASKLDGYRRSLLYRSAHPVEPVPFVILFHEFESDPGDLASVKADMAAIEQSKDCSFQIRSYKLLTSEGFGGRCQKPERLED